MELLNVNTVIVPLLVGLMGLMGVVLVQRLVAANRMQKALEAHRESVEGALARIGSEMTTIRSEMGTLRSEMVQMRAELREEIAKVDGKVEYLTRRVNAMQSDVSYIRGRMFITDDQLPAGSKVVDSPSDPSAQPSAVETTPNPLAVQA